MRATATHGIVLDNAFVPDENALTVPATFVKMTRVSRGSFVGNQVALSSVYIGAAQAVYDYAMQFLRTTTYHGTDEPIGGSDMHRQLIGSMRAHLDTALPVGPPSDSLGDRQSRDPGETRCGLELADRQRRDRRQLLRCGRLCA